MPKINEVILNPTSKPALVEFQNGRIQSGEENSLESAQFSDSSTGNIVVGVANGDMIYTGEVDENENNDLYNNFLMVQQEGSNVIQLIQVNSCIVAPLLVPKKSSEETTPVKKQSFGDLRKQFGSKKAKRFTEQQERLAMNIENVTEHLEKTVANVNVSETPITLSEDSESAYKPKINRDATTKEQVYQLYDLVPAEVLESLEEKVTEILESDDIKDFELIASVENNIQILRSTLPEKDLMVKCEILLYIHYLVKFMVTPLKVMNKRFVICECSEKVNTHIKENYMVNWLRPLSMKDKGTCYTIVLIMLAMDYETDLELLSKDMKIGIKRMQEFARNLGFSQSSKSKTSIMLKIPVPPPPPSFLKRKRNTM